MVSLPCPTGSLTLKPKPEPARRDIRCPNCETLVRGPEGGGA